LIKNDGKSFNKLQEINYVEIFDNSYVRDLVDYFWSDPIPEESY